MYWIFTDCCNLQHHQAVNSVAIFTYIVTFSNNKKQSCISYNPVYGIEESFSLKLELVVLDAASKELINVTPTTTNHRTELKLPDRDVVSILWWVTNEQILYIYPRFTKWWYHTTRGNRQQYSAKIGMLEPCDSEVSLWTPCCFLYRHDTLLVLSEGHDNFPMQWFQDCLQWIKDIEFITDDSPTSRPQNPVHLNNNWDRLLTSTTQEKAYQELHLIIVQWPFFLLVTEINLIPRCDLVGY